MVENPSLKVDTDGRKYLKYTVTYTLRDVGPTVAPFLADAGASGTLVKGDLGCRVFRDRDFGTNGESLGPEASVTEDESGENDVGVNDVVQGKQRFEVLIQEYWRDIFNKGHQTATILEYNPTGDPFTQIYPDCK